MGFECDGRDGVWAVFVAFVKFCEVVGVVRCVGCVSGTRQGSNRSGGGDHNVEVHRGVGCVESDVGSVEWSGIILLVVVGDDVGGVVHDDLFGEGALSSDAEDEVH